jgi:hypothetical protein
LFSKDQARTGHALPQTPHDTDDHGADMRRKKSLVHPYRERIEPGHRQWHYRNIADSTRVDVMPSGPSFFNLVFARC